jgi:hypothetical protein
VAPEPHAGNPELETARRAAMHALEIRDEADILAGMSRGELEALVAEGQRAQAAAPRDVSARLRATGQASSDTWGQAAAARGRQAGGGVGRRALAASLRPSMPGWTWPGLA